MLSFSHWLTKSFQRANKSPRRRTHALPPRLEQLEDRLVPSGIGVVVDNNNGTNSATVFDPTMNKVLGSVPLPVSSFTNGDVALVNQGTLGFVTNFKNSLMVLNLTNPNAPTLASGINQIPISNPGEDIGVTPDQKFLVVSDGSTDTPLSVVSVSSRSEVSTFNLTLKVGTQTIPTNANSVDITSTGSVLVTSTAGSVPGVVRRLTLDSSGTLSNTGESLSVWSPNQVTAAPGGNSGVVVSEQGFIESFLVPGLTPVDTRAVSGKVLSAVFDPAGDRVYVRSTPEDVPGALPGTVTVFGFNPTTGQLSSAPLFTISVAPAQTFFAIDQMTISPDGSELYVSDDSSHSVDVFNASNGSPVTTITGPSISYPTGIAIATATQLSPTVTVTDAGGIYNGNTFPATATAVGVDGKTSVNGSLTLAYYVGSSATGTSSATAPSDAGTYTVVATFQSSDPNYTDGSAQTTFTIAQATTSLGNLTDRQILVGMSATTISGQLTSNTIVPVGQSVAITLNGLMQSALVGANGNFSTSFATGALGVGQYTIAYSYAGNNNFTAATGAGSLTVTYGTELLFNNRKPVHSGACLPIKLALTDAGGADISSPNIAVTADSLVDAKGNSVTPSAEGHANPNNLFRYDSGLGGYIFNLDTKGLAPGAYTLYYTVGNDPTRHSLTFLVD